MITTLTALVVACGSSSYEEPLGEYQYDRGRAQACKDVRAGKFIYYVAGHEALKIAALSEKTESDYGFVIVYAYTDECPDCTDDVDFAEGYNSISVPAIEKKCGAKIIELLKQCATTK